MLFLHADRECVRIQISTISVLMSLKQRCSISINISTSTRPTREQPWGNQRLKLSNYAAIKIEDEDEEHVILACSMFFLFEEKVMIAKLFDCIDLLSTTSQIDDMIIHVMQSLENSSSLWWFMYCFKQQNKHRSPTTGLFLLFLTNWA